VVDTSGYVPRVVRASAALLAPRVGRYLFVSTLSVYADERAPGQDESAPLALLPDPAVEEVTPETYGGLKALCERVVTGAFGDRATVVRPGLIVGPHDPTDRFTYWPVRVARGGDVVAPSGPGYRVQFVDARDLARWMLELLRTDRAGVFNATGPDEPLPLGDLLDACRRVSGADARFVWIDEAFLLGNGVRPWMDLPLWIDGEAGVGGNSFDTGRARAAGLRLRPVRETVADTLAWARERPPSDLRAGLTPEREAALLRAWERRS
jgi:2'-hydroxyisoflavone reductase